MGLEYTITYDEAAAASSIRPLEFTVTNADIVSIAIKVATMHPRWYAIAPRRVAVPPKSTATVSVFLAPPPGPGQQREDPGAKATTAGVAPTHVTAPTTDLLRFEVRALINITTAAPPEILALNGDPDAFASAWERGVRQPEQNFPVKLDPTPYPDYAVHLAKLRDEAAARHRAQEQALAEDALRLELEAARLRRRDAGYRGDLEKAERWAAAKENIVRLPWPLFLLAVAAAFVAGLPQGVASL